MHAADPESSDANLELLEPQCTDDTQATGSVARAEQRVLQPTTSGGPVQTSAPSDTVPAEKKRKEKPPQMAKISQGTLARIPEDLLLMSSKFAKSFLLQPEDTSRDEDLACNAFVTLLKLRRTFQVSFKEHAAALLLIAETIIRGDALAGYIKESRSRRYGAMAALSMLQLIANDNKTSIPEVVALCHFILTTSAAFPYIEKRALYTLKNIIDAEGIFALAAFNRAVAISDLHPIVPIQAPAFETSEALQKWRELATQTLESLPTANEGWFPIMNAYYRDDATSMPDTLDKTAGTSEWHLLPAKQRKTVAKISWTALNVNSLNKRLEKGDLARFLADHGENDVLFFSEIKTAVKDKPIYVALKHALRDLGFCHVLWNWCAKDSNNYGTAIFSKIAFKNHTFGMCTAPDNAHVSHDDPEGRVITTYMDNFAVVWTYAPCSALKEDAPSPRKTSYNEKFKTHCNAVRRSTPTLFVVGDLNVTPLITDTSLPEDIRIDFPSCRQYERDAHAAFCDDLDLVNAQEMLTSGPPPMSWSGRHVPEPHPDHPERPKYLKIRMRLDHVLCPPHVLTPQTATETTMHMTSISTSQGTYGSDHHALTVHMDIAPTQEEHRAHPPIAPLFKAAVLASLLPEEFTHTRPFGDYRNAPLYAVQCPLTPAHDVQRILAATGLLELKRPLTEASPGLTRTPIAISGGTEIKLNRETRPQNARSGGKKEKDSRRKEPRTHVRVEKSRLSAETFHGNYKHLDHATLMSVRATANEMIRQEKEDHERTQTAWHAPLAPLSLVAPSRHALLPGYTPYKTPKMTSFSRFRSTLPHSTKKAVPEIQLQMHGRETRCTKTVTAMVDTGSYYNIMTMELAKELGLDVSNNVELPCLELADSARTRPLGSVSVDCLVQGKMLPIQFFVFPAGPFAAILGSHFLDFAGADINFKTHSIKFNFDSECLTAPFSLVRPPSIEEPQGAMRVVEAFEVPARSAMNVRLEFANTALVDTWGFVEDAKKSCVLVGRGVTCAARPQPADGEDHYWCEVMNVSDMTMKVRKGQVIAQFTPFSVDEYAAMKDSWDAPAAAPAAFAAAGPEMPAETLPFQGPTDEEWATYSHLQELDMKDAEKTLTTEEFARLRALIIKHERLWEQCPKEPPPYAEVAHIAVDDETRFFARTRMVSPGQRGDMIELVQGQIDKGIIEPSKSEFSSPVVLLPKKGGGIRFTIDYRALNKRVKHDSWTLPRVNESLSALAGNKYFSSLDMKDGFWSVPLSEESKKYTAFQTPNGLMQYRRMPMGLRISSAVFCRYVDKIIGAMKWVKVMAYVDDLLVFSKDYAGHLDALDELFGRLNHYNLTLGAKKCTFFAPSVIFLGHKVSVDGLHPDPSKTSAIGAITLPSNAAGLRSALGLMAYYRNFVPRFSDVAKPLRDKLLAPSSSWHKDAKGEVPYTTAETESFYTLKKHLTSEPILVHPDWNLPFELHTDASMSGLGATLIQLQPCGPEGKLREVVVSYASRSLTDPESRYAIWELECLAIVWGMRLQRMYLTGRFKVYTDSTAAKSIMTTPREDSCGRIMRWSLAVQDFDFEMLHRSAAKNASADALSRAPHGSTEPYGEGPTCVDPPASFATFVAAADDVDAASDAAADKGRHWSKEYFEGGDYQAYDAQGFVDRLASDATPGTARIARNVAPSREQTSLTRPYYYDAQRCGLLRKIGRPGTNDTTFVPIGLRAFVLNRFHGLPISGHLGHNRTYRMVSALYCWPRMQRDIRRWIAACLTCKKRKTPRHGKAGTFTAVSQCTTPNETLALDISTAVKSSVDGYVAILTVLDLFTRYVIAIPLRTKGAKDVAEALFSHVFCRSGPPKNIVTDQGREFVNKGLEAMLQMYKISFKSTGGYQPQANPVERYHRFMNHVMSMLSTEYGEDWPAYLPIACFAYNTSTNATTGFTPFEMTYMMGRPLSLQEVGETEIVLESRDEGKYGDADAMDPRYVALFHDKAKERLQRTYDKVIKEQARIHGVNAEYENRRRHALRKDGKAIPLLEFNVDDNVLYWQPQQSMHLRKGVVAKATETPVKKPTKWTPKWTGPHVITAKTESASGYTYTFFHANWAVPVSTHVNRLTFYQPWSDTVADTAPSSTVDRPYLRGECADAGSLVVVPLGRPYPFGLGRITEVLEDGYLLIRWYGNESNRPQGTYLPGWKATRRGGERTVYYADARKRSVDTPYMTSDDGVCLHQRDITIHSFALTNTFRLSTPLLRVIARDVYVWWEQLQLPHLSFSFYSGGVIYRSVPRRAHRI